MENECFGLFLGRAIKNDCGNKKTACGAFTAPVRDHSVTT
jgi:hypothetical protein